jgi:hypothetical protein
MARGSIAKEDVIQKIAQAFGADYLGCADKKYYVYGMENGEKIQIAISLTCPKVDVEFAAQPLKGMDWNETTVGDAPAAQVSLPVTEVTQEERDTIAELMSRLGL